jgi:hypothetical protein
MLENQADLRVGSRRRRAAPLTLVVSLHGGVSRIVPLLFALP